MPALDRITILHSAEGKLMTKTFSRHYKTGQITKSNYQCAKYFIPEVVEVSNIYELSILLERLELAKYACVVRGELIDANSATPIRRLCHDDCKTGSKATIKPACRRWIMIDIDGIDCPSLTDPADDPNDAIEYLIGLLPAELQDVTCYYQWSSSQGMKDDTLSAHIWVWLEQNISDDSLKRWANNANKSAGRKLVDIALYNPVQPHYTASPIFNDVRDPLPKRSGIRKGLEDEALLIIPEKKALPKYESSGLGIRITGGLSEYLKLIGSEAGFHRPIISAIASYISINGPAGTDTQALKEQIRAVIYSADAGSRDFETIERYASDLYLDGIINWVISQELSNANIQHSKSVTSFLPPYFPLPHQSRDEALTIQNGVITNFLAAAHKLHNARVEIKCQRQLRFTEEDLI